MKSLAKITVATVLAIAAAAPAFAKDIKQVRHGYAVSQNDGTRAQASVPLTAPSFDPAEYANQY